WVLARAPRAGLGGGPEPRHRVPWGGGETRATARVGRRFGPAPRRRGGGRGTHRDPCGPARHAHNSDRDDRHRGSRVGEGFVASLARPGGNLTGMSLQMMELPGKRLELLKETVPQSTRVAVLANPAFEVNTLYLRNLTVAAQALGLHLHVVEVRSADELDAAFAAMTRAGADALMVLSDPALMDNLVGRMADLAATHRLP